MNRLSDSKEGLRLLRQDLTRAAKRDKTRSGKYNGIYICISDTYISLARQKLIELEKFIKKLEVLEKKVERRKKEAQKKVRHPNSFSGTYGRGR